MLLVGGFLFIGIKIGKKVLDLVKEIKKELDTQLDTQLDTLYRKPKGQNRLTFSEHYIGKIPDEIKDLMSQMMHKQRYEDAKIDIGKGLLIAGPPGVGKTFLIKVLSDEVDADIHILTGSEAKGGYYRGSGSKGKQKNLGKRKKIQNIQFY